MGAPLPNLNPVNLPLIDDNAETQGPRQNQNSLSALAAASLGNLLGKIGSLSSTIREDDRQAGVGYGLLLGEALPPVPPKLANKLKKGHFVEMQEMLPDMWLAAENGDPPQRGSRHQVMDIRVWAQCFTTYVRVIAEDEPERVPDLLDYIINIIRASQGSAWLRYDGTFRKQVAVSGKKSWGAYNSSLYAMCYTGKPKPWADVITASARTTTLNLEAQSNNCSDTVICQCRVCSAPNGSRVF